MLSAAERVAGRRFKTECLELLRALMDADPPTHRTLPLLGVYRHACPRRGTSTAIALKEIYRLSPAYPSVPAGRFGFIFKEGRCAHCRATVRSEGRLVDGWERPPLRGRRDREADLSKREDTPEKEPPQQETVPGPTYENPNEDEVYVPVDRAVEEASGEDE